MILIFDYFETIIHNRSMDFNRGLKTLWEKYYEDKCSFEEMAAFGEELFEHMLEAHRQGVEYAFVKEELPEYAKRYGGDPVRMTAAEEADFLMKCNEMENMPHVPEALAAFEKLGIPMYVLSNSGFTAEALSIAPEKLGIRKYFKQIWSSADFGKVKPSREFFEMAIESALAENPAEKRENIVFVGDTYASDVKGANAAGIDVIWINHKGEQNTENLSVHSISDAGELAGMVKKIREGNMFLDTAFLKNDEIKLVLEKTVEGDAEKEWMPAYHFAICDPDGEKMGVCDLRIGHNEKLYYGGNIGYRVDENYRGHHYAGKACRLLFELARKHQLGYVIITCNPDNLASRKTCDYLGGELLEIAELPEDNDMRADGETQKCIFRFEL